MTQHTGEKRPAPEGEQQSPKRLAIRNLREASPARESSDDELEIVNPRSLDTARAAKRVNFDGIRMVDCTDEELFMMAPAEDPAPRASGSREGLLTGKPLYPNEVDMTAFERLHRGIKQNHLGDEFGRRSVAENWRGTVNRRKGQLIESDFPKLLIQLDKDICVSFESYSRMVVAVGKNPADEARGCNVLIRKPGGGSYFSPWTMDRQDGKYLKRLADETGLHDCFDERIKGRVQTALFLPAVMARRDRHAFIGGDVLRTQLYVENVGIGELYNPEEVILQNYGKTGLPTGNFTPLYLHARGWGDENGNRQFKEMTPAQREFLGLSSLPVGERSLDLTDERFRGRGRAPTEQLDIGYHSTTDEKLPSRPATPASEMPDDVYIVEPENSDRIAAFVAESQPPSELQIRDHAAAAAREWKQLSDGWRPHLAAVSEQDVPPKLHSLRRAMIVRAGRAGDAGRG